MIMICNVPNEVVESVKMGTWCGSSVAEKMIANGVPLDKIRAEIGNINLNEVAAKYEDRFYGFQREVIKILDKYKGESEG